MPEFIDSDYLGRSLAQSEEGSEPIPIYLRAAITPAELAKLRVELEELRRGIYQYEILDRVYPRAFKLMRKRNFFLIVAIDEPYYEGVYWMVRAGEKEIGRWSDDDQHTMDAALYIRKQLKGDQNADSRISTQSR